MQAGLRTLITGKLTKTLTETLATKAADSVGLSPTNAGRVGMAVDFAAGLFNPGAVGKLAMREGAERLGREGAEHLDDAAKALRANPPAGVDGPVRRCIPGAAAAGAGGLGEGGVRILSSGPRACRDSRSLWSRATTLAVR